MKNELMRQGKNAETDAEIIDALECAQLMEKEGRSGVNAPTLDQMEANDLPLLV